LVRKLIVPINDELEKEMSAFPEVDWVEVTIRAIRNCLRDREKIRFYNTIIDRAMAQERKQRSQERKQRSKSSTKKSQMLCALRSE
jgi:hypothetical protein